MCYALRFTSQNACGAIIFGFIVRELEDMPYIDYTISSILIQCNQLSFFVLY